MNATKKPPRPKLQLYKDRKYLLVQYDRSNYAVLSGTKYKTTNRINQAVLGYYPSVQAGLEEIIRLRAEDQLLKKVGDLRPFTSLDTLVSEYTKSVITVIDQVISHVQQHKNQALRAPNLHQSSFS